MSLLTCLFAVILCTIAWYKTVLKDELKLSFLYYLYWGASLMWMIDAVFGYIEEGADFFVPTATDMLNDFYLGLSVVALGLIIWLINLLIKDPQGKVKAVLLKKN